MTSELHDSLEQLVGRLPAPPRTDDLRTRARSRVRRRKAVTGAAGAVVALALAATVWSVLPFGRSTVAFQPGSGEVAPVGSGWQPAAPPPATRTTRPYYADAPTIQEQPVDRALLSFGFGDTEHWSLFVVDDETREVRVAADVATGWQSGRQAYALSPDGARLAYALNGPWDAEGVLLDPAPYEWQVVVVDLATGEHTRVPAADPVGVAWAPDGRLAWLNGADATDLVVLESGGRLSRTALGAGYDRLEWSPDGRRVLVEDYELAAQAQVLTVDGTEPVRVLPRATEVYGARWPWLPDSERILGIARNETGVLVPLDGEEQLALPGDHAGLLPIAVSPDGTMLLENVSSGGAGQPYVRVVDLATGEVLHEFTDPDTVPWVLGWHGDDRILVAHEYGGTRVASHPLDGRPGETLFEAAISHEGFTGDAFDVARWFTQG